ncbi:MAG: hypothetical protein AAGM38_18685 [Pseudomonadota bacterium]
MGQSAQNFRFYLDNDDGTPVKAEVTGVETLSLNTGRSIDTVVTKDSVHTFDNDSGFSASISLVRELPAGAGQNLLWATHEANATRRFYLESTDAGGDTFSGEARIAIESIESPARGVNMYSVTLYAQGAVTRGVAS